MNGELSDVTKGVLVSGGVVVDVDFRSGVLHDVDRGKGVDRGLLARSQEGEVDAL